MTAVIHAKAGIQALNGPCAPRTIERLIAGGSAPSPILSRVACGDAYWWVADPRQVTFLCTDKEKSPKEIRPGWREFPLRFSPESARAPTRRAHTTRLGLEHEAREYPDSSCDARARHTGLKEHPCQGLRWVAPSPSERAEHRARPGEVARLLIEPEACFSAPGELGERPAAARRAGHRAPCARRSDRGAFSLVTFSWAYKRKSPAVGQPPTSTRRPQGGSTTASGIEHRG